MIEKSVHSWLRRKDIPEGTSALVVEFNKLPEEKLAAASSAGERIRIIREHVASRMTAVLEEQGLSQDMVEVTGLGSAIIRAEPAMLRDLVAKEAPLARADDLLVRPNEFIPGDAGSHG